MFLRFGTGHAWDPRWSPTAEVVVFVANESRNDALWLVRKGEWPAVQLTQNAWQWDKHPRWSPAGAPIIFVSNRRGGQQRWLMNADGGNQRQLTNVDFAVWDSMGVKDKDNKGAVKMRCACHGRAQRAVTRRRPARQKVYKRQPKNVENPDDCA